jgi:hypothetical protein
VLARAANRNRAHGGAGVVLALRLDHFIHNRRSRRVVRVVLGRASPESRGSNASVGALGT